MWKFDIYFEVVVEMLEFEKRGKNWVIVIVFLLEVVFCVLCVG